MFPENLINEWHPTKNVEPLTSFSFASRKEGVWVCSKGHEWKARIAHRTNGSGCPFCAGRKVFPGFNDALTVNPEISKQWHHIKNGSLSPSEVIAGSHSKAWWLCDYGHEWEAPIRNRILKKHGCPSCAGKKIEPGINDLGTVSPKLAMEWDYQKNLVSITSVAPNTKQSYYWLCKKGHSWSAPVYNRNTLKNNCPYCSGRLPLQGVNDLFSATDKIIQEYSNSLNEISITKISQGSSKKVFWECENHHIWQTTPYNRVKRNTNCPYCSNQTSTGEKNLGIFIEEELKQEVVFRSKSVIAPYELDIYLPEKNFAVEFNGLYWHTEEQGKGKYYHYDKWEACKEKGIQLVQVWEDDWNRNPDLVKRMIVHKLGVAGERKVYARNTFVRELSHSASDVFLNEFHIQGAPIKGSVVIGLFENIILDAGVEIKPVAVMVLKKEPGEGNTLNLLRFATSVSVVGGFTKLLKYVEKELKPSSIVTFSDNCVSDGGLYEKHGFENVRELKPDYMYVVKGERVHKFNYRLKRFREDPDLEYNEKLSERELALLNNIPRIWDAGKTKWVKKVQ